MKLDLKADILSPKMVSAIMIVRVNLYQTTCMPRVTNLKAKKFPQNGFKQGVWSGGGLFFGWGLIR